MRRAQGPRSLAGRHRKILDITNFNWLAVVCVRQAQFEQVSTIPTSDVYHDSMLAKWLTPANNYCMAFNGTLPLKHLS